MSPKIHELDDGTFVISDAGGWLPGYYADWDAADYAFNFHEAVLHDLTGRICHVHQENRAITVADLQAAARGLQP